MSRSSVSYLDSVSYIKCILVSDISLQHRDEGGNFLIVLEPVSVSVTVEVTPDLVNIIVLIGEDSMKGTQDI